MVAGSRASEHKILDFLKGLFVLFGFLSSLCAGKKRGFERKGDRMERMRERSTKMEGARLRKRFLPDTQAQKGEQRGRERQGGKATDQT